MRLKCAHSSQDIDIRTGLTTYIYCQADATNHFEGVDYCANHVVENSRRVKVANLLAEIDENRPQS